MTTQLTRIAMALARAAGDCDLDAIPAHKAAALKAWQKTGILREEPFRDDYIAMARAAVESMRSCSGVVTVAPGQSPFDAVISAILSEKV